MQGQCHLLNTYYMSRSFLHLAPSNRHAETVCVFNSACQTHGASSHVALSVRVWWQESSSRGQKAEGTWLMTCLVPQFS